MHLTSTGVGCDASDAADEDGIDVGAALASGEWSSVCVAAQAFDEVSFSSTLMPAFLNRWLRGSCLLTYLYRGRRCCGKDFAVSGCHFVQSYAPSARGSPTAGKKSCA